MMTKNKKIQDKKKITRTIIETEPKKQKKNKHDKGGKIQKINVKTRTEGKLRS